MKRKLFFLSSIYGFCLHNKQSFLMAFIWCVSMLKFTNLHAQQERKDIRQGNELYKEKKYEAADKKYDEALKKKPNSVEALYNKGNVLYQNKKYEDAAKQFETVATMSNDNNIKAKAYHNMGNSFMENKKYQDAVNAYKNSLKSNPSDADTKYNLSYALQKLRQEQNQQKKDDKNKDKNEEKNKDQQDQKNKQDQDKKDQEQQQKEQQEKNDKEGQNEQPKDPKDEKGEEKKPEKQQPKPSQISKEDAKKLLDALKNEEQKVQEKLQKNKGKYEKVKTEKDW